MKKGKIVALGIAVAIAIVAGFAFAVSTQNSQTDAPPINPTGEGRNLTLNLEEKFSIETNPP